MIKGKKAVRCKICRYIGLSVFLFVGFLIARQIEWQGNKTLHTLMEVAATLLALMVGILALIRFYTKKDNVFLFIGSGFLGTAFLDGYHAVVTSAFFDSYFPSPPPSLIPWSWVASRLFLSILMCLSWWTSRLKPSQGAEDERQISEQIVFSGVAAATLFSFLFFAIYPLPRAYYPELFFGRPEEFVPAFFFLVALVGYLKRGRWKEDPFENWVVISLIVGFMGQVMFMSFSDRLFDTMFDAAHLLKKVSYICMMQGLFVAMFRLFKEAEAGRVQAEIARLESEAGRVQAEIGRLESEAGRVQSEAERMQSEIGRLESESIVESSPNGMMMMSEDGRIRLVNAVVERIFGYSRNDLIGKTIESLIPERFRNKHGGHITGFIKSPKSRRMGEGLSDMILLGQRKDGSEVPLEIGLGYIKNDKGMFILVALTDISERRAVEKKLASERSALKKANLELDSFVYTASHDLRAPLRGINSFSKFIEEDYADRLDDEGRDYIKRIRNGVRRMTQLIDDLLSLSVISRQNNPYETVQVDQMIRSVTERIEFDLEASHVDLVIPEHLPAIRCDRIKVSEVFLNLLNNAIKFSQKNNIGGSEGPKVEIGYEERNGDYQFSVKDNGIGIEPQYHEKVFKLFQRLHARGKYEGTGVGLSIVKRIIDDHKGRVWIESESGKGATFYFTIPKNIESESKN